MINSQEIKEGIIGVYKPVGPSSFDMIRRLRILTGVKKIGHAGTLDPLARGILVVGIGRSACRSLEKEVKKEKEYLAVIKLGEESTTDDQEGKKTIKENINRPSKKEILEILPQFQGKIEQVPPFFSAIKIKGKRAYQLARQGQRPIIKSRLVEIKNIELLEYQWPYLEIKVLTGPGAYVRSLARDLGQKLNCGGYLFDLERTRVGEFNKDNSIYLE
ncbi:tRNA pseudouridine(55) synthase TruB [Patescibacteria group bacterium]|nr:tRNA pseudouridine(55) synthase TruB [Patescibacteria group bacterium]